MEDLKWIKAQHHVKFKLKLYLNDYDIKKDLTEFLNSNDIIDLYITGLEN